MNDALQGPSMKSDEVPTPPPAAKREDCAINGAPATNGYRLSAWRRRARRNAFTLFELIIAVALSAILLTLVGTAISLYLTRVDADRSRVEEAQLARSVLTMITDDIRAASIYQPQDTSSVAQLMAASKPFDVDSLDEARKSAGGSTSLGTPGGTGTTSKATSLSGSSASASSSASSSSSSSSSSADEESDDTLPLGLSGTIDELYVDVTQLPRLEELFGTVTGYANVAVPTSAGLAGASGATTELNPPADLKSVRYFVRSADTMNVIVADEMMEAGRAGDESGGLVRQEIPRSMRVFAEQAGNTDVLDTGAVLVAAEVVQIRFRYFDGAELFDIWEMKEQKKLPLAIEVTIWLRSAAPAPDSIGSEERLAENVEGAREYRQIVYLPMSTLAASGDGSASAETSAESSTSSTSSSSGGSPAGSTSAFGEP